MEEGKHIKVQIYRARREDLSSVKVSSDFLRRTVESTGMQILGAPHVYDIGEELRRQGEEPNELEPEGVTGIAVLSTSHVAIHTWPHRGYAVVDVFSCRSFDSADVLRVVEKVFSPAVVNIVDLTYSLKFPEPPEPST